MSKKLKNKTPKKKKITLKQVNEYLKLLSFKNLNYKIQDYGFNYSFGKYMSAVFIMLTAIVLSTYLFKLSSNSVVVLSIVSVLLLPFIILSQIHFLYNNFRFEQINTYMQEMITVFKTKPKIRYSLIETSKLFDRGIKKNIDEAILYIDAGDESGAEKYKKALSIIEKKYPCSRIHSLHNLMCTVEGQNSVNYQKAIDDLYDDIQAWVARTYNYQFELKNTKGQFNIILLMTIGVAAVMVNVMPENMVGFTTTPLYQATTTLMLGLFLGMYGFVQSKLNGQWLVNDMDDEDERILKSLYYIENYDEKKAKKKSMMIAAALSFFPLFGVIIKSQKLMTFGFVACIVGFFWNTLQYKTHFKNVEKEIKKSFPTWLRDISLSMHNLVVTNAIRQSYVNAPTVIKYYLNDFLKELEADPVSIRPYNNFLKKFYINDINSAMKSLYSIKQQELSESSKQVSDLIVKNQKMMETSERIRNENQIAGINMIGALPMVIAALKMIIDMFLLITTFMSSIQTPI